MSSVSCDQNSPGPLAVQSSAQKRRSGSVASDGPSEHLEPSSPLSEAVVVRPGAVKRRIRSAGPRLELGNSAGTGDDDDAGAIVVRPCLSPPVSPFQRPLHSEDRGGPESKNANKKYHLVITRCEAQPLEEALNLSASISPHLHFRGLDSLLQKPSPRPPNDPTQEALTTSPPPQGRLLVLDPAVGVPAQETVSRLTEVGSAQSPPRIVSVKREECMKKEHAAMFLGQDRAAKQQRTVTVSRSNTWSFDGRGTGPRTPGSRPLLASSNSSILEGGGGGSLTDHNRSGVLSDEVLAENTEEELDSDDMFEWNSFRPLGRSKTREAKKSCILRSNSVQLSSARKSESQERMRVVSWLDIEPDAK